MALRIQPKPHQLLAGATATKAPRVGTRTPSGHTPPPKAGLGAYGAKKATWSEPQGTPRPWPWPKKATWAALLRPRIR